MKNIERYVKCENCNGTGRDEPDECGLCGGEGNIENEAYWRALLPNPIPFKESREAQLEYFNLKRNG